LAPLDADGISERSNAPPAPPRHRIGPSCAQPLFSRCDGANVKPEWLCSIAFPNKSVATSLERVELMSKLMNWLTADLLGRRPALKGRQQPVPSRRTRSRRFLHC